MVKGGPATHALRRAKYLGNRTGSLQCQRLQRLTRILRLGRLIEFTLAAIAQNLRRLAKLAARPPPTPAACVA